MTATAGEKPVQSLGCIIPTTFYQGLIQHIFEIYFD